MSAIGVAADVETDLVLQLVTGFVLILSLAACDRTEDASTHGMRPSTEGWKYPAARGRYDSRMLALEDSLPGFGGMWEDSLGRTHIVLTDTGHIRRARELVPWMEPGRRGFRQVRPPGVPAGTEMLIAQQGRYSYSELRHWGRRVFDAGPRVVAAVSIMPRTNKLEVGILKPFPLDSMHRVFTQAGIPNDAFDLVPEDPRPSGGSPAATRRKASDTSRPAT